MPGINHLAVVVATVTAFVVSTVWYSVFGKEMMKLQSAKPDAIANMEKPQPWKILVEIVRSLVVTYHPSGKSRRNISKHDHEAIKQAIVEALRNKELTHTEPVNRLNTRFINVLKPRRSCLLSYRGRS